MSAEKPCLQESECVMCRDCNRTDPLTELTGKGLDTLLHFSNLRRYVELNQYLKSKPGIVRVHSDCRREFTSKRRYEQHQRRNTASSDDPAVKHLRTKVDTFDWKHDCFYAVRLLTDDSVIQSITW